MRKPRSSKWPAYVRILRQRGEGKRVERLREFIDSGEPRRLQLQEALYAIRELLAGKHCDTLKAAAEYVAARRRTMQADNPEVLRIAVRDKVAHGWLSAKRAQKALADMREAGELHEVTFPEFDITAARLLQLWRDPSNPLRATVRVKRGRPKRKKAANTPLRAH